MAEANAGMTVDELVQELAQCLELVRVKHTDYARLTEGPGALAKVSPAVTADLVLMLTSPAIRRRFLEVE